MTDEQGNSYSFSYEVDSYSHGIVEEPIVLQEEATVPVEIFRHASTVQALARYLVDIQGMSFTGAANLLHRSPKSIWTSYHQTGELPDVDEKSIRVPVRIFLTQMSPLEALVLYLKSLGLKNVETAKLLGLDPRTTHTAMKRGEVKR